ncbi:MAG: alpha/beta hydrolase [Xenococcaceae cyanobacterium MO_207.B15]|nr:alpha/beta hydrolase [Xenococcaceae cyanobacterium MO_207.B15]
MIKESNPKDKIITLRGGEKGYKIKDKVDGKTQIHYREIIILVHGYNVSEEDAEKSYTAFQEYFEKYCCPLSELDKAIYRFFWPSDEPNKVVSALSYHKKVATAKECGEKFAQYLEKLNLISISNKPPSVILIGHSLGCRLLLEALKKPLKTDYKLKVFLMAPAVPVFMVKPGEELDHSISSAEKSTILYSEKDRVLRRTFPPGQALAGEGFNEAVGLKGNPRFGVWDEREEMSYGHGGYWGYSNDPTKKEKELESAKFIVEQLGVLKPSSRNPNLQRTIGTSERGDLTERKIRERKDPKARSRM